MITDADKERVRQATDFQALVAETVELRQRGTDFWGCCPFHHEKSPSFHMNPATGLWNCFGCHKGGDIFDYVMEREHLEFPDAIRYLADRAGIELVEERGAAARGPKRNRLMQANEEAEAFYQTMLLRGRGEGPSSGRAYLGSRGFGSDVCRRWHLGYAPGRGALVADLKSHGFDSRECLAADLASDGGGGRLRDRFFERVMFPIHDELGRAIAFGGRVLTDAKPKYLNTRDTPIFHKHKNLFGIDRAKEAIAATGVALVVEGYTDVIALHEHGFKNAVAALGTALSLDHVKTLSRFRVKTIICMFDGDAAGQKAAELSVQYLDKTDAQMKCVVLPNNQDPMEFLGDHTSSELQAILDAAEPLMDFVFRKKLAGYDLSVPGQRVRALDDMAGVLSPLKGSMLLDDYASQLADLLGMDLDAVKRTIRNKPAPRDKQTGSYQDRGGSRPGKGGAKAGTPWADEGPAVPYDDYGYAEEPVDEADAAIVYATPNLAALSNDERQQIAGERELLALMAASPDVVRPYGDRIATIVWADSRHESMAWAMLATPVGTSPADVVAAATQVVADAPKILSAGRLGSMTDASAAKRAAFLIDTVELCSAKRQVRSIRGQLRRSSGGEVDAHAQELFAKATDLQRRINELTLALSRGKEG